MATYRHWYLSLWRDPDDVPRCRILSPDKTEWLLISATLCGWRRCFVADQLWFMTRIREEVGLFHGNYICISYRFWDIQTTATPSYLSELVQTHAPPWTLSLLHLSGTLYTCWHSTVQEHSYFQMSLDNPSVQTHLVLLCCIKRLCIFGPKGAIQIRYYYYYYYLLLWHLFLIIIIIIIK